MSIHKTAAGTYRVRWRATGRMRSKNFRRKVDAEKFQANVLLGNGDKTEKEVAKEAPSMKLREFAEKWLVNHAEVHKTASSVIRDRQMLRDYILPKLGGLPLRSIVKADVVDLQAGLKSGTTLSVKSVNLVMGLLHKILDDATAWGEMRTNPMRGVTRIKCPQVDYKFWSVAERERLLDVAESKDVVIYRIIAVTVHTGMRLGELAGLLRDALDFERQEITVKRSFCYKTGKLNEYTKGKTIRRVPMNRVVFDILLEEKGKDGSEPVFAYDFQHLLWRKFRPLQRVAGVTEIKFHDLRHTFASHLAMAGVSVFDIQQMLGHSDIKTTMRYMHLAPDHLKGKTDVLVQCQAGRRGADKYASSS